MRSKSRRMLPPRNPGPHAASRDVLDTSRHLAGSAMHDGAGICLRPETGIRSDMSDRKQDG